MKYLVNIFVLIFIVFVSGCNVPCGITKVGSPSDNPQEPEVMGPSEDAPEGSDDGTGGSSEGNSELLVDDYLGDHPYWKGEPDVDEDAEDLHIVFFDMEEMTAVLYSPEYIEPYELVITKEDDGSIIAYSPDGGGLKIETDIDEDSPEQPLDIKIIDEENNIVINMFASTIMDAAYHENFYNPQFMCSMSGSGCYDSDGDLDGTDEYFIAGMVQADWPDGESCGMAISDYCVEEGKTLAEIVCNPDPEAQEKYLIRYVYCDCRKGKCVQGSRRVPQVIEPVRIH